LKRTIESFRYPNIQGIIPAKVRAHQPCRGWKIRKNEGGGDDLDLFE